MEKSSVPQQTSAAKATTSLREGEKLVDYFSRYEGKRLDKWLHYFDIYERYFAPYRGTDCVFLEIGISQGGSLEMWRQYLGPDARIIGVDIDPRCKQFEQDGFEVFIGSQSDPQFLEHLKEAVPKVDILLDDGGHTMHQQKTTFAHLFDHVKSDGIYLCEDTHTSYWLKYGGGVRRKGTFIEFSKRLIDSLHAYHSEQPERLSVNALTNQLKAIHFYDSVVVFEKQARSQPTSEAHGDEVFRRETWHGTQKISTYVKYKRVGLRVVNKGLRFFNIRGFVWK